MWRYERGIPWPERALGWWVSIGGDDGDGEGLPEERVQSSRVVGEEVPGGIMCCSSLGHLMIWAWLDRVNQIRELNTILNKEDWNIISHDIYPITTLASSSPSHSPTGVYQNSP